mmetsp:Transcript_8724/g.12397  ORF Transcript_8724/g.12397 Transcript_8724/m.12397 type:complete len:311 (-) Transcript_8724:46-978(-)
MKTMYHPSMRMIVFTILSTIHLVVPSTGFAYVHKHVRTTSVPVSSSWNRNWRQWSSGTDEDDSATPPVMMNKIDRLEDLKESLVRLCVGSSNGGTGTKPSLGDVLSVVRELESVAEEVGIGQASSSSGLLSGEWELLYAPEDVTRSSPFFWAFRNAFPENASQIFSITDAIPAPIKEVGPAYQTIDTDAKTFVSRVKVATLGGIATSVMTTRATLLGSEGVDGMRWRIDTTKPEDSTVLQKLGPLGKVLNDNSKPFPSGEVLEKVRPGASEVIIRTTFCDEAVRISRDENYLDDVFVWKKKRDLATTSDV